MVDPAGGHKIVGDVAFDEAVKVAGRITKVPGGLGHVTFALLLRNVRPCGGARLDLKFYSVPCMRFAVAAKPLRSCCIRSGVEDHRRFKGSRIGSSVTVACGLLGPRF